MSIVYGYNGAKTISLWANILLIIFGCFMIFWEVATHMQYRAIAETEALVRSASLAFVDVANEGLPVYLSGTVTVGGAARDPLFAVGGADEPFVRLRRIVEMYQWREYEDAPYDTVWARRLIDSTDFPAEYQNPTEMPFRSETFHAEQLQLGAYDLDRAFVDSMREERLDLTQIERPLNLERTVYWLEDYIYLSDDPDSPQVGDVRVAFQAIPAGQTVSLIAQQSGQTLQLASDMRFVNELWAGQYTVSEILAFQQQASLTFSYCFRGLFIIICLVAFFYGIPPQAKYRHWTIPLLTITALAVVMGLGWLLAALM